MNNTFSLTSRRALHITQCSDPQMWYANKVGQIVDYCGEWPEAYVSREPSGHLNKVLFKDAKIVHVDAAAPSSPAAPAKPTEPAPQTWIESLGEALVSGAICMVIVVLLAGLIDLLEEMRMGGLLVASPLIFWAAFSVGIFVIRRLFVSTDLEPVK